MEIESNFVRYLKAVRRTKGWVVTCNTVRNNIYAFYLRFVEIMNI